MGVLTIRAQLFRVCVRAPDFGSSQIAKHFLCFGECNYVYLGNDTNMSIYLVTVNTIYAMAHMSYEQC